MTQGTNMDRSVVTRHLKNIFESGELTEDSTCANFAQVADNGKPISISSILSRRLLRLAIVSIPVEWFNSGSERRFYQKIADIYATAVDYFLGSQITREFFAKVQNKITCCFLS